MEVSIASLADLSTKVAILCTRYSSGSEENLAAILQLSNRVYNLGHGTYSYEWRSGETGTSELLRQALTSSIEVLNKLRIRLEPGKARRAMNSLGIRSLKWPLQGVSEANFMVDVEACQRLISSTLLCKEYPIYGADSLASPVRRSWLEPSTVPPISGRTGVKNLPPIFLMEPSSNAARMITPDIAEIKNSQKASNVSLKSNMFVPLQEREIRLFNWTTSGKSDEVCGVLVTRSLNDDLYYDALSYVWGGTPGKNSPSIMVNGQSVLITKNLHAALRAFGLKGIKRPIWIDSVCINQKDKEERLRQVKSMGEIYRRAANVHIWLGEVEGFTKEPTYHIGTDYLRRFLNELSALVSDKDMISTPFYRITRVPIGDYSADRLIKRMTTSDWFSRMWVIQESAFAQNTTMHFGVWSCSWMAGEEAVRFLRRLKFASACPDWDIIIQSRSVGSRRVRYSAGSWYSPMINLLEVSVLNYYGSRPPPDLLDLLYETREKESADPRDRIFGLLEFSAAQCCTPLEIDHNLDESAIWDRILAHLKTCKDHLPI